MNIRVWYKPVRGKECDTQSKVVVLPRMPETKEDLAALVKAVGITDPIQICRWKEAR